MNNLFLICMFLLGMLIAGSIGIGMLWFLTHKFKDTTDFDVFIEDNKEDKAHE